jgi:hypothetical protein
MGWIDKRLNQFGVPTKHIDPSTIKNYDFNMVVKFVKKRRNLVVVGSQFYEKCIRLMRLRMLIDKTATLRWLSQTQLNFETETNGADVLALVQLYDDPTPSKKSLAGCVVNTVLSQGGQVLIGCSCTEALEAAFPYDLDMIELEFDFWKETCKCGKEPS